MTGIDDHSRFVVCAKAVLRASPVDETIIASQRFGKFTGQAEADLGHGLLDCRFSSAAGCDPAEVTLIAATLLGYLMSVGG